MMFSKYLHGPNVHVHSITDDTVCLSGYCRSGQYHEMVVDKQNLMGYNNGALIQDAFPNLDVHEREFFKTGIAPDDVFLGETV